MADLLLYGVIGDWWDGLDAARVIEAIDTSEGDLNVRINSPGGLVMEGLTIYNGLLRAKAAGRKITCYVDGLAASMGSVIAMVGDQIVMAEASLMMVHNPWDCACGDATELRQAADRLDQLRDIIVGIYAKQTGLAPDALVALMDAETWLTPADALGHNFITSVGEAVTASASFVQPFGFRKVPDSPLISAMAMARSTLTAPPVASTKDDPMKPIPGTTAADANTVTETQTQPAAPQAAAPAATATGAVTAALTSTDVATTTQAAIAEERARASAIRALGDKHAVPADVINGLIDAGTPLAEAREKVLDHLATRTDAHTAGGPSMTITRDARDKWIEGATNWLLISNGQQAAVESYGAMRAEKTGNAAYRVQLDPGEFRGVSPTDLAREALQMGNVRLNSRDPREIVGAALTARNEITQGSGDFGILLENLMHKTLQAAYGITPDTWSLFCGKGTLKDFRAHNRYLRGTFSSLDALNELGEFKNKSIPDGEKQTITGKTMGNIVSLTRQAIINDDMGVFVTMASDLGRAAKLTIEKDVYALLLANGAMYDGIALFHASHGNLAASGSATNVASLDAGRVAMASQKDPSGNDFLDLRPDIWLGPIGKQKDAQVTIRSPYDPDATSKLQRPNFVEGLVSTIIGTPRLTGTQWYLFANKNSAPAIEVAFLNGVEEPFLDNEMGWRVDGTEWKVRLDYGVGAVNWRSAYADPGA